MPLPPTPVAVTEANIENALSKDNIPLNPNLYQDEEGNWHHKEDHGFDFLGKGVADGFIPNKIVGW